MTAVHARQSPILLAVPNFSEGRDGGVVRSITEALLAVAGSPAGGGVRLLDVHTDADHDRAVYTLAGPPGALGDALLRGAREAVSRIDVMAGAPAAPAPAAPSGPPAALAPAAAPAPAAIPAPTAPAAPSGPAAPAPPAPAAASGPPAAPASAAASGPAAPASGAILATGAANPRGVHPHVGALDVAPIVYLEEATRGAALAEALVLADRIGGELGVPVFLYGELAGGRTRAQVRRGGVMELARRIAAGELRPDFGPPHLHPRAGAVLVAARAPLVAFNLELAAPATVADARRIAALIREGGAEGLPGVRAIGMGLRGGEAGEVAQVSMNIERPFETPLRAVIARVRAHARVTRGELVGLAPRKALEGLPEDVPLPGFDPARHVLERAIEHAREGVDEGTSEDAHESADEGTRAGEPQ